MWAEVRQIDRHVRWMSDARRIDFHSPQREGVGTTFDCRTRVGPFTTTDVMRVTRWEDDSLIGVTHQGIFTGHGELRLSDEGDATRVTWREHLVFPWWAGGAVGAILARPVLRALWRKNLATLAALLTPPSGRP